MTIVLIATVVGVFYCLIRAWLATECKHEFYVDNNFYPSPLELCKKCSRMSPAAYENMVRQHQESK